MAKLCPSPQSVSLIMQTVCEQLLLTRDQVQGTSRHARVILARELVAVLARELTDRSFPEIAGDTGRPNHSSVISARNRGLRRMDDPEPVLPTQITPPISFGALLQRIRQAIIDKDTANARASLDRSPQPHGHA